MKRTIVAAIAAIGIVGFASASSVTWGTASGASVSKDLGSGNIFANQTVYLVYGTSVPDFVTLGKSKTSWSAADIGGTTIRTGTLDANGSYSVVGDSIVPADIGKTATTAAKFYLAAISTDGQWIAYTGLKTATISTGSMGANATFTTSNFSYAEAVPEPTTMALLAIGLAAFGLRRKVQK